MATIAHVRSTGAGTALNVEKFLWETMTDDDVGDAVILQGSPYCSLHGIGTFGGSVTLTVEGSNDGGSTWNTLDDMSGAPMTTAVAAIFTFRSSALAVRVQTAGGTSADIDCYLIARHAP